MNPKTGSSHKLALLAGALSASLFVLSCSGRENKSENQNQSQVKEAPTEETMKGRLPCPPGLEDRVALWEKVYGEFNRAYLVFYHRDYPGIIYAAVPDLPGKKQKTIAQIRKDLLRAHALMQKPNPEAELKRTNDPRLIKLFDKFKNISDPEKFRKAAGRGAIATLRGKKEELKEAYQRAEPYLPAMEKIFRERSLPPELTRLVFVESMFNRKAVSSKNAAGVWQITPAAAEGLLIKNELVDERRDPIKSAEAAAQILAENYERFHSWPLAVTAYNAGPALVARAVKTTGARSLPELLAKYDHSAFGFAVRNFYAQLLAILRVERSRGLYPPRKPRLIVNPLDYELVPLPRALTLSELARVSGMDEQLLVQYNPAWTPAVEKSKLSLPEGYLVRVPRGAGPAVKSALALKNRKTRVLLGSEKGNGSSFSLPGR